MAAIASEFPKNIVNYATSGVPSTSASRGGQSEIAFLGNKYSTSTKTSKNFWWLFLVIHSKFWFQI